MKLFNKSDRTFAIKSDKAADVTFSPDQTLVYISTADGNIDVFNVATAQKMSSWHIGDALGAVTVSEDGSFLLAVDLRQPLIYQIDTKTGAILKTIVGTGTAYRDIEIVDANTAILTGRNPVSMDLRTFVTTPLVNAVSYSGSSVMTEDQHLTLLGETGISNGPLALYDDRTGTIVARGDSYQSNVSGFNFGSQAVSEAAGLVFQFIYSGSINVYDLSLAYKRTVNIGASISGMVADPAGKFVYAYLAEGFVVKYDIISFNEVERYQTTKTSINSSTLNYGNALKVSADGRHLVATDIETGHVDLIDLTGRSEMLTGTDGDDALSGGGGNDSIAGGAGNDRLAGDAGNDSLFGQDGNDLLSGGRGSDRIDGGGGDNVLLLDGAARDYHVTRTADGYSVRDGYDVDQIVNVQKVSFDGGGTSITFADLQTRSFDPNAYLASYADLRAAFGMDTVAASQHYFATGIGEGRNPAIFDGQIYAATHPDLARAFGLDGAAATVHYLNNGIAEGRAASGFDPFLYAASNPDLIRAFGSDANQFLRHYLSTGVNEGRPTGGFDTLRYAASNPDLARVIGTDEHALAAHYILFGLDEGRSADSFDPLAYAATNADLARAFGVDATMLERHYVTNGLSEGRVTDGFDAVAYLISNPDLGAAGLDAPGALRHWVDVGVDEGRVGDALFGRDQTDHAATIYGVMRGTIDQARDRDWYSITLRAGATMMLDLVGDQRSDPKGVALADPRMTLYDANGRVVASDADSGPGRDASILFTADKSGTYYVEAAGENAFGIFDVGGYTLTIVPEYFW